MPRKEYSYNSSKREMRKPKRDENKQNSTCTTAFHVTHTQISVHVTCNTYIRTHMYVYQDGYIEMRVLMCIYIYIYICIYTRIYIYICIYTIDRDIVCLRMNEPLRHALVLSDSPPSLFPSVCFTSSVDSVSVTLFLLSCSHYIMCKHTFLLPSID